MHKITPFLWFDHGAEEAAAYYVDVFNGNPAMKKKSKLLTTNRYDEDSAKASGQSAGSVLTVAFELEGARFTALNGGSVLKMTGGVSFVVECETQAEIDYFWKKLGEDGGETGQCGWINHDKFGVTWQIVPASLSDYIGGDDEEGAARAMKAMLGMTKLDIAKLKAAYTGKQ